MLHAEPQEDRPDVPRSVQDREMVESLGYRIARCSSRVIVGSALAGLGGVMWGLFQQNVIPQIGAQVNSADLHRHHHRWPRVDAGCFIGALLVGADRQLRGYLAPHRRDVLSAIGLHVARCLCSGARKGFSLSELTGVR